MLKGQASPASRKSMIEEVLQSFRAIGSKRGEALALNNLAGVLQDMANVDDAEVAYRRASEILGEIGELGNLAFTRNNLGTIAQGRGDLATALKEYEAALATFRVLKSRGGIAFELSNIGEALRLRGDLTASLKDRQEVLAIYRELHYEDGTAQTLWTTAETLADQGLLALAKRDYEEALAISRKSGNQRNAAVALDALAVVVMHQGDLVAARRLYDNATELNKQDASSARARRPVTVRLLLEEGKVLDAERIVRAAIQESHDSHLPMDEASWRTLLARCLVRETHLREAPAELDRVAVLLKKSQNQVIRFDFLITAALVKAASGTTADKSEALGTLAAAIRESRKYSFVGFGLEARLATGEIEMQLGGAAASRDLAAIKRDADALGYGLISGKAAKVLQNGQSRP